MAEGGDVVKRLWAAQQRRFALWSPFFIGVGVWVRLDSGWDVPDFVMVVCVLVRHWWRLCVAQARGGHRHLSERCYRAFPCWISGRNGAGCLD